MISWREPVRSLRSVFLGSTGLVLGMWRAGFSGGGCPLSPSHDYQVEDARWNIDPRFWPGSFDMRLGVNIIPNVLVAVPTRDEVGILEEALPRISRYSVAVAVVLRDGISAPRNFSSLDAPVASRVLRWGGQDFSLHLAMRSSPDEVLSRVLVPDLPVKIRGRVAECKMFGKYKMSFSYLEELFGFPVGSTSCLGRRSEFFDTTVPACVGEALGRAILGEK